MSPVAVEFASAWSAPGGGACFVVPVVVVGVLVVGVVEPGVLVVPVVVVAPDVVVVGVLFVWAARKDGEEDRALQKKLGIRRRTRL